MGRAVLILLALAACEKKSALYCEKHPDDRMNCPQPDAPRVACMQDPDCTAPRPRCDPQSMTCVECVGAADCMDPARPVCDGASHTCHGCAVSADCASNVCLADGSCADAATVLYASTTAMAGQMCTQTEPCRLADALGKLTMASAYTTISLAAGMYVLNSALQLDDRGKPYRLVGERSDANGPPQAIVTGANFALIAIGGGASVELDTLDVSGGGTDGIVSQSGGATLIVRACYVHGNRGIGINTDSTALTVDGSWIVQNKGRGLDASSSMVAITNNVIAANGDPMMFSVGGASLNSSCTGFARFNTIVDNVEAPGSTEPAGFLCDGNVDASANLLTNNHAGMTYESPSLTNGCTLGSGASASFAATQTDDAMLFEATNPQWGSYHLKPTAPDSVRDVPGFSCDGVDIDRDRRPQGPACDLGADEVTP